MGFDANVKISGGIILFDNHRFFVIPMVTNEIRAEREKYFLVNPITF